MPAPDDAGRRVEVLFLDDDRVLEVRTDSDDADQVVDAVVQAVDRNNADEAEQRIRAAVGDTGSVIRR